MISEKQLIKWTTTPVPMSFYPVPPGPPFDISAVKTYNYMHKKVLPIDG